MFFQIFKTLKYRDFPGDPVVKTPCFQQKGILWETLESLGSKTAIIKFIFLFNKYLLDDYCCPLIRLQSGAITPNFRDDMKL